MDTGHNSPDQNINEPNEQKKQQQQNSNTTDTHRNCAQTIKHNIK